MLLATPAAHVGPHLWLGVLRGPVLADLSIVGWEDLPPGPWLRDLCIVLDHDGALAAVRAASQATGTLYAGDWLSGLTERWWRWMFYCAKDNRRGDWLLVLGNFDFLRRNAFMPLFAVLEGTPIELIGRPRDRDRTDRLAAVLANAGRSQPEWDATVVRLHTLFLELRAEAMQLVPHAVPSNEPALEAELRRALSTPRPPAAG